MGMPDLVDDLHRVRVRVLNLLLGGSKKRKSLMIFFVFNEKSHFFDEKSQFFCYKKMHCYKIFARAPARESNTHANVRINLMHPNAQGPGKFLVSPENYV